MERKKIFIVSTNRSDYGLLQPIIKQFNNSSFFDLTVIKLQELKNHISDETINIQWHEEIISYETCSENIAKTLNGFDEIGKSFSILINKYKPKLILILGDRYELLKIVSQALIAKIPLAHFSGGEITLGAIDDKIRNMVSFASDIHFVAHVQASKRLKKILGDFVSSNIHVVGDPGLEEIKNAKLKDIQELSTLYKLKLNQKFILVTLHPETNNKFFYKSASIFFDSLMKIQSSIPILISYGNNDPIGFDLNKMMIDKLGNRKNTYICSSFGQINYWSLLSNAHIIIGNSSSGLVEAPLFGCWTIDVGFRQSGRIHGNTVKRIKIDSDIINKTLLCLLNKERSIERESPYGDGKTSLKVFQIVKDFFKKSS